MTIHATEDPRNKSELAATAAQLTGNRAPTETASRVRSVRDDIKLAAQHVQTTAQQHTLAHDALKRALNRLRAETHEKHQPVPLLSSDPRHNTNTPTAALAIALLRELATLEKGDWSPLATALTNALLLDFDAIALMLDTNTPE